MPNTYTVFRTRLQGCIDKHFTDSGLIKQPEDCRWAFSDIRRYDSIPNPEKERPVLAALESGATQMSVCVELNYNQKLYSVNKQ